MVQLMLAGFGGDRRKTRDDTNNPHESALGAGSNPGAYGVDCYHVNARLSQNLEDIGDFRLGKFILLLW